MDDFATAAQMEQRSLGAIPADRPFLGEALKAASGRIRDHCRWHVAKVEALTFKRAGLYPSRVWLPAMQITAITAVTIDGTELDAGTLETVEYDPDSGSTNLWGRTWSIDYSAGYSEIPESIVDLTLLIAARSLGSPLGAVREQTLVSSVTWSQPSFNTAGGTVLLPHEEDALSEYRLGRLP